MKRQSIDTWLFDILNSLDAITEDGSWVLELLFEQLNGFGQHIYIHIIHVWTYK